MRRPFSLAGGDVAAARLGIADGARGRPASRRCRGRSASRRGPRSRIGSRTPTQAPTVDYSETTKDFDLEGQGFKRIGPEEMMIDFELAFQKHPIRLLKASMTRYK